MTKHFDLSAIDRDKYILREDLVSYIKDNTNYEKESSVRWVIHELVKEGELTKLNSNFYYHGILEEYHPNETSKKMLDVKKTIKKQYPDLDVVIYESNILNEWLNHQIAKNVIFVEVEKYYMEFVFDHLKEKYKQGILYSPSTDEFNLYGENNVIIINNLISRAPMKRNGTEIMIEKLIVDVFSPDLISSLFSKSEYEAILEGIFGKYKVNTKKVLSYAKRRNLSEIVGKYVSNYDPRKGISND